MRTDKTFYIRYLFKYICINVEMTKNLHNLCCNLHPLPEQYLSSPALPTPEPPQATAGSDQHGFLKRDYLHGAWQGGLARSAPTDCDTYLMQAPVCLRCLIRAQCAGLGRGDPFACTDSGATHSLTGLAL